MIKCLKTCVNFHIYSFERFFFLSSSPIFPSPLLSIDIVIIIMNKVPMYSITPLLHCAILFDAWVEHDVEWSYKVKLMAHTECERTRTFRNSNFVSWMFYVSRSCNIEASGESFQWNIGLMFMQHCRCKHSIEATRDVLPLSVSLQRSCSTSKTCLLKYFWEKKYSIVNFSRASKRKIILMMTEMK